MTRVVEGKRRKKRTPRGRSGCLTCRERRVKCDEVKPVCGNCVKINRTCKGYEAAHLPSNTIDALRFVERQPSWTTGSSSSPRSSRPDTESPRISVLSLINPTEQDPYHGAFNHHQQTHVVQQYEHNMVQVYDEEIKRDYDEDSMQGIVKYEHPSQESMWTICRPLLVFDSDTQRAIDFFNQRTIHQIGSWFSLPLWSQIPKIAHSEKTIEHAMVALTNFHEQYTTGLPPRYALAHYNKAVQLLHGGIPKAESVLCLIMFYAIELLHRSHTSAMQLLRVARRIMFDIRMEQSELYTFLRNLIRRIDRQVTETCGSIDPELSYDDLWGAEPFMSRNLVPKLRFRTHRDAYDAIIFIIQSYVNDPQPIHDNYLNMIAMWRVKFEDFKSLTDLDKESIAKIPGLEVYWRHYQIVICKDRDSPIQQTWWDQHETILDEMLDYLDLDPDMNRGTSFGLEHCLVYQLFKIGRECRSPKIRRRILKWLRNLKMQEGVLTGELVYKVLGKVIRVEEGNQHVASSSQIPECRRIQEVQLVFDDDLKVMKYRLDDEWHHEIVTGA